MPAKYICKTYVSDGYYHVFNRGVDKRKIFIDEHDYNTFVSLFKRYLEPGYRLERNDPRSGKKILAESNYSYEKVELLTFVLMPNHFHLLLKQKTEDGMTDLIRKVCTGYSTYFNEKYARSGKLYESTYKAILIENEDSFYQISRYIHINPKPLLRGRGLRDYKFSGFYYICKDIKLPWLQWDEVVGDQGVKSYKDFVLSKIKEDFTEKEASLLKGITLE